VRNPVATLKNSYLRLTYGVDEVEVLKIVEGRKYSASEADDVSYNFFGKTNDKFSIETTNTLFQFVYSTGCFSVLLESN